MARKNQPYIPLFVQDVLTDEKLIECSASAHGIYFRLICILHKQAEYGTILLKQKYKQKSSTRFDVVCGFARMLSRQMPFDKDVIQRGLHELVAEDIIQIDGEKLLQKRMVKDNELSIKRSEAGRKGGKSTHFAKAKDQANTEIESEIESESEIDSSIKNEFEEFWNLYANRVGKKDCFKKWKRLSKSQKQRIFEVLPAYVAATPGGKYRMNPNNWIAGEHWNDEIKSIQENESKSSFRSKDQEDRRNDQQEVAGSYMSSMEKLKRKIENETQRNSIGPRSEDGFSGSICD